jgi:hypothetical protein
LQAGLGVVVAATELCPPPAPAERPPPEYEREAVSAAEGMIAFLREAGGESGEASGTPATAEPKDDRRDGA